MQERSTAKMVKNIRLGYILYIPIVTNQHPCSFTMVNMFEHVYNDGKHLQSLPNVLGTLIQ